MTLAKAVNMLSMGKLPNQIIFKLNDDKTTYSVDCVFDSIKENGEYKNVTLHSDKVSYPKDTDFYITTRDNENVWFDIIIPDE